MKYSLFFAFLFVILFSDLHAQERLIGLNQNPLIHKQISFKSSTEEAVFLPFFDDFKQSGQYPNPALWSDQYAFVNTGFQKFPANMGVATLDALDENGEIYSHANSFGFIADHLTSNSIRLDSLATEHRPIVKADSLYLSFYFQPQGSGNAPESTDSLVLEFYSGRDQIWYRIWSSEGMPLDSFYLKNQTYCKQILIPITDSARFYHPDFKFRFYNYASLASSIQTSWQSNADEWNIDYVKLDVGRNRNDIYSEALAFVNPPPSFLKNYRNMPYNQYKNDPTNSMVDSLHSIYISNLNSVPYTAEYQYTISGQLLQDSVYLAGSAMINPFIQAGYADFPRFKDPRVVTFFSLYNTDQKSYTITHVVKSLDQPEIGDTVIQQQLFGDYYAYDDGTAEAGYGLSGAGNSAALRFKLNMPDTLTQVKMYFNPTIIGNTDYFYLTVWESLDPEVVLYEALVQVDMSQREAGFQTFDLDEIVLVSNDFYVGFTQISESNLNVGFDLSYAPKESLYFNAGNGWDSSIFDGSLMIRPVFSTSTIEAPSPDSEDEEVLIYPNPLKSGSLKIDINNGTDYLIKVYSLVGKLIYSTKYNEEINLDFLRNGVYLLRFENQMDGKTRIQKLIISR